MTKNTDKQSGRNKTNQHAFRLNDEDTLAFEGLAAAEGFGTIAAWAESLVRRRAALLKRHIDEGTFVTIHGMKIPYTEVPGSSGYECQLFNAQALMSQPLDEESLTTAAKWLAEVQAFGTDDQVARSKKIAMRLPPSIRMKIPMLVEHAKSAAPF